MDALILEKVKLSLRRSHSKLDDDLLDQIAACLADLKTVGIVESKLKPSEEMDPLILNAVKLYCKAENAEEPAKAAEFMRRYEALKSCLMMAEGYGYEEEGANE